MIQKPRDARDQKRSSETSFQKLFKKYKRDFETNTLPEIRKRLHYLTPSQKRKAKDKRAKIRNREEQHESNQG